MTRPEIQSRAATKRAAASAVAAYARALTRWTSAHTIAVASESTPGTVYTVTIDGDYHCDCPAGAHGRPCKHLGVAAEFASAHGAERPSLATAARDADPVWSDYDDIEAPQRPQERYWSAVPPVGRGVAPDPSWSPPARVYARLPRDV